MSYGPNWSGGTTTRRAALELLGGLVIVAMIPENPVVGGTVLRRAAIQSPNFATGVSGWSINQNGSAEFNNVVIRNGQIVSGSALFYSGPPALGNLIASVSATADTDSFGNSYQAGVTTYSGTQSVQHNATRIFWVNAGEFAAAFAGLATVISGLDALQLQSPQIGNLYTAAVLNLVGRNTGTGLVQVPAGTAFEADAGATVAGGLGVTGGETADTIAISNSGNNPLLSITQLTGASSAVVRIQLPAAASQQIGLILQEAGDTNPRLVLDIDAAGNPRLRFGSGSAVPDIQFARNAAGNQMDLTASDLDIKTIGRGIKIAEGTNARMGQATLVAGLKTVANTSVTGTTRIFLSVQSRGGTVGFLDISSVTVGTNFTIRSSSTTDTSTVNWLLIEPG